MTLSAFQVISISVIIVGLLLVLESVVIIGGKGIDINGELPFMAFGSLFVGGMPAYLGLLGTWDKSWYWYILIGFLTFSGFTAYVRSRGYTIRLFDTKLQSVVGGLEKSFKQNRTTYQKTEKALQSGTEVQYVFGEGKYPLFVTEKKPSPLLEAHIEIIGTEALWNKDLQLQLSLFVNSRRFNSPATNMMRLVLRRTLVGVLTILLGVYLLGF